jgi:hypothetical protein
MQPGCSPPPVAIQKDDHQPRGGEKQAGLWPPPHPQLQGCSSSSLGWRASQVGALPSVWAGDPLLSPAFGGEGCSPALRRRQTSATRGRLAAGHQLERVWPFGLDGFGAASDAASCRLAGAWLSVHHTGDGRAMRGSATSMASPARRPHWGVIQDVVRRGSGGRVLGWSCPHSRGRTGARTPSCMLRQPPSTGAEVGAVIGAEVVAAAGEATHCRGGCLRWRDHQSHLLPSPRLFGFNGLVVTPPVGGRGRRPPRNGTHPEVVAAAGKPLGAEVVVAAGAEVVAVVGEPLVQRWSPAPVRPPGASFQCDSCWCSAVHSCINGARALLVRECNNICLLGSGM